MAQSQPNDWINFSSNSAYSDQRYYRVKVAQEGIYRLNVATLNNGSGLNPTEVENIDPAYFRIFYRGVEQAIYVENNGNANKFDGSDFIEFYGQRNDGMPDRDLYVNSYASYQADTLGMANPYYSNFTDTAVYFLTWKEGVNGLRMIPGPGGAFTSPDPLFFYAESFNEYVSFYSRGSANQSLLAHSIAPDYLQSEGWIDNVNISPTSSINKTLSTPNTYGAGPSATCEVSLAARSYDDFVFNDHQVNMQLNGGSTVSFNFDGTNVGRHTFSFSPASFPTTSTLSFSASGGLVDVSRVAYIKIKYPHSFLFSGETAYRMLLPNNGPISYLEMNGLNMSSISDVVFYNITDRLRIPVTAFGASLRAIIPNPSSAPERLCYISVQPATVISSIEPVSTNPATLGLFRNFRTNTGNYLMITHSSLMSPASQYRNYRQSSVGGSYQVVLADIDELYDQFAWGIAKHPLAVRNFASFAISEWPEKPEYLFLIGKSLGKHDGTDASLSPRKYPAYYAKHLLPCWSTPTSDVSFTQNMDGSGFAPAIATGRIAARVPGEVQIYLNKIMDYEDELPDAWMKNVMHFVGGENSAQINLLATYMNTYKSIIEDSLFGGNVQTFVKAANVPITTNLSDSLMQRISKGVALMTFFGHDNQVGFDYSINAPSNFENIHRYPFVISLGCYSGDSYGSLNSIGEEFVFADMEGAIGFVADNTTGLISGMNSFAYTFYKNFALHKYNQSIGIIMQQTVSECSAPLDWSARSAFMNMNLQCDPALVLYSHKKPDLKITQQDVYFTPTPVTTDLSSFNMYMIVSNIGMANDSPFKIKVKRTFPDGTVSTDIYPHAPVYYNDTVIINIPITNNAGGINLFDIELDSDFEVDELLETNNNVTTELIIESTDLIPVYPYDFAIVPSNTVTLKASTSNPFAPTRTYYLQLDTTDSFDSPFLKQTSVTQSGGVVSWGPLQLLPTDSMVYFWRSWFLPSQKKESSFTFINGKTGWSQSKFKQFFKGDSIINMNPVASSRRFDFINSTNEFKINTHNEFVSPWTLPIQGASQFDINYSMNNVLGSNFPRAWFFSLSRSYVVSVIDPATCLPWVCDSTANSPLYGANTGTYNSFHFNDYSTTFFEFLVNNAGFQQAFADFINIVPVGHTVLLYSTGYNDINTFIPSLDSAFRSIGVGAAFDSLRANPSLNARPYIVFGKKGAAPGSASEIYGATDSTAISIMDTTQCIWTDGYYLSSRIGPASKWTSIHWDVKDYSGSNATFKDTIRLSLIGLNVNGTLDTLIKNLPPTATDSLISSIDVNMYPYLKFHAYVKDDSLRSPIQLYKWQVYYEGVPEVALNPSRFFSFYNGTVQQGDSIRLSTVVENIGPMPVLPLQTDFWVTDASRKRNYMPFVLTRPLPVGAFDTVDVVFSSYDFPGKNSLWVEVNPFNGSHKLESHHFNNIGYIPFTVNKDATNPLLDVTFDGVHILNGDIVSAKPQIILQLKDENKYLALDDTSLFAIWLKYPNQSYQERLFFESGENSGLGNSRLKWTRAKMPDNKFTIEYNPKLAEDGIYELIAESRDASGNLSGKIRYRISFEVINRSTITEILNYPNPFTTATRFAFVLTGSEIPTYFKIQIMTVTGKVVREITREELGSIHIGRNLTTYVWNGTDEYGDRLANGVYLYRAIIRLNNETIEHRATEADAYFKKGWGKMYLMR